MFKSFETRAVALYGLAAQGVILLWLAFDTSRVRLYEYEDLSIVSLYFITAVAILLFHYLSVRLRSDIIFLVNCYLSFCVMPKIVALAFGLEPSLMYWYQRDYLPDSAVQSALNKYLLFCLALTLGIFIAGRLPGKARGGTAVAGFRPIEQVLGQLSWRVATPILIWAGLTLYPLVTGSFYQRFGQSAIPERGTASLLDYGMTFVTYYLFPDFIYKPLTILLALFSRRLRPLCLGLMALILVFQTLSGIKGAVFYQMQIVIILMGTSYLATRVKWRHIIYSVLLVVPAAAASYLVAANLREKVYLTGRVAFDSFSHLLFAMFYRQGDIFEATVVALSSPLFENRLTVWRSFKAFVDGPITPGFDLFGGELNGSHSFHYILQGAVGLSDYFYQSTPLGFIPEVVISFPSGWPIAAVFIGFILSRMLAYKGSRGSPELFYLFVLNAIFYMGFLGGGLDELANGLLYLIIGFKVFMLFTGSSIRPTPAPDSFSA